VISSQDDRTSVATCIEAGAEDHISKPYEPLVLNARVKTSLERKRMRDVERDYLARVAQLTSAAEAVERETYVTGSLDALMRDDDELGRLARVFDRMVAGLRSREGRLQRRLHQLRQEMADSGAKALEGTAVSADSAFQSGEILAARYEILGHLGKGGMGMVYHARDRELGEEVALKVVRQDLVAGDPTLVDRLKSEIRMARKISHRNVVRAHDLGEWKGTYFITMEYVRGMQLSDLLDRRGRLSIDSTLAIGTQLSDALTVAHEQDIIHRDVKPANLLIDEAGALKVMDFGLARPVHRGWEENITVAGFIVGTPQYMAPEQLMGGDVDARSDLFSVGIVLYECLAGRPPFDADSPVALAAQMLEGRVTPIGDLAPEVPARLANAVHQLLQLHPKDRLGSARDLGHTLSEIEHSPHA
jgi:serine/threonine protein kinase